MNNTTKQKVNSYQSEIRNAAGILKQLMQSVSADSPDFKKLRAYVEQKLFDKYIDEDFESEGQLPENDIDIAVDLDRLLGIEIDKDVLEHWIDEYGKAGTGIENV